MLKKNVALAAAVAGAVAVLSRLPCDHCSQQTGHGHRSGPVR